MRTLRHPPIDQITLSAVLHALSDPLRLCVVRTLAEKGELPCGTFCMPERPGGGAAKSTMSHHFKVLRESGIIAMRSAGTSCYNSLRREELEARFPGLLEAVLHAAGPL